MRTPARPATWRAPTSTRPIDAVVHLPGSKSASNRALVLASLSDAPSIQRGVLDARDTQLMIDALRRLGVEIEVVASDSIGNVDVRVTPHLLRGDTSIDVGLAGTVMRFVPPVAALAHGPVAFDGDAHARERPMATVIESIRDLGGTVDDRGTGRLPFTVVGAGELRGGEVTVDASRSSQFISALLLSAARFEAGVTIHHVGEPIPSMPHIDMTIAMLAEHGVAVRQSGTTLWHVDPHDVAAFDRAIEPDLTNAAPFLAAALATGGRVVVPDWPSGTTQPGDELRPILAAMGADVTLTDGALTVTSSGDIAGIDIDLHHAGELAPTVVALAALASSPSRIRGISHLRGHETDRLAALSAEINGLGGAVEETDDGLVVTPRDLHGGVFGTHGDHRLATTAAVLGLRTSGVEIVDVETTAKTLPDFVGRWEALLGDAGPAD